MPFAIQLRDLFTPFLDESSELGKATQTTSIIPQTAIVLRVGFSYKPTFLVVEGNELEFRSLEDPATSTDGRFRDSTFV